MKKTVFYIYILLSVFFAACSDDNGTKGGSKTENEEINEWTYKEMSHYYYWNDKLPSENGIDLNIAPDKFFYRILYKYKTLGGDRFSYLENDGVIQFSDGLVAASNKPKWDIGFEYVVFTNAEQTQINGFCVTYVKKGSQAEKQELKRGDWITEINGEKPTMSNYHSILHTGKSEYKLKFNNREDLALRPSDNFAENPVFLTKTFTSNGSKIGYIIYNFFDNDSGDKSNQYAIDMNSKLEEMSSAGIDYLILDLRYNGGGLVKSGNYIASAIVPNRGANGENIYTKRAFNKTYDAELRKEGENNYKNRTTEFFYDKIASKYSIPQLKLKKLYVITSKSTASASEQIINGLSAYMDVEIIGETTIGKNMESFEMANDKEHKWVLHPLTSVSYRNDKTPATNDYSKGFMPTIGWEALRSNQQTTYSLENDEFQTLRETGELYELGDEREILLAKTLENITGVKRTTSVTRSSTTMPITNPIASSLDKKQRPLIVTFE